MDSVDIPCVFGVDVGGTNTDAVVLLNNKVFSWSKQTTTADVTTGVLNALISVLNDCRKKTEKLKIQQINIGTTHFVNAVVQRSSSLSKVAVIRLAKPPCTQAIVPFSDFPDSLKKIVNGGFAFVDGGYEFDGREMAPVNEVEIIETVKKFVDDNITNFAICGVFSSTKQDQELRVAAILQKHFRNVSFTCSHELGQIGLLERENASILNESLKYLCKKTIGGLKTGLSKIGLHCPLYFTQNDGTICSIERALMYPVFTFASGPTNSMRGAAFVSGLKDAVVVDIGGTSTDIGILVNGFPRQAGVRVKVAEVPTNFRMPHTISLALGGGTKIYFENDGDEITIGPESVGYMLTAEAVCFGGNILTTTDAAVVGGLLPDISANEKLNKSLNKDQSSKILNCVRSIVEEGVDQMKTDAAPVPVVLVGGGSIILDKSATLVGSEQTVTVEHHSVANAIGAALCQVSGQIDNVVPMEHGNANFDRNELIKSVKERTIETAVKNGAMENDVKIVEFDEIPLTYLPGNAVRMKCTAIGPLKVDPSNYQELMFSTLPILTHLSHDVVIDQSKHVKNQDTANVDNSSSFISHSPLQKAPWTLNMTDIEYICEGAAILGCGGGGSPHTGKLRLMNLLNKRKCPTVVSHEWIIKNCKGHIPVFSVGYMGAPVIMIEKLPAGCESLNAIGLSYAVHKNKELLNVKDIRNDLGCDYIDYMALPCIENEPCKDYAVMTPEIGGINSTEALAVSAELGIYCVDCDEMGRAFPELQMSTKLIYGQQPYPSVQANERGRLSVTISGESHKANENLNRKICIENGCSSAFVLGSVPADKIDHCCVIGSISRAWLLGKSVFEAKKLKQSPINAVLAVEIGKLICNGKLVDVQRKIESGFCKGQFTLEGLGEYSGKLYTVDFQNENLIIKCDEAILATVPDLICLIDTESGEAIPTEELRYGLRASLLVLKPSPLLTTQQALEVVGPKAFGFKNIDYLSFFNNKN